jgi:hypothetical protein
LKESAHRPHLVLLVLRTSSALTHTQRSTVSLVCGAAARRRNAEPKQNKPKTLTLLVAAALRRIDELPISLVRHIHLD